VTIRTFTVSLDEIDQESPCSITVNWNVIGPPDTEAYLYKGPGTTVGTAPASRVAEADVGPGSFTEPFAVGTRSYRLQAVSPSDGSALNAPVTVTPICIDDFKTHDGCSQEVSWIVYGGPPGATYTLFRRGGSSQFTSISSGPVSYGKPQAFYDDLGSSLTYEYRLQVTVAGRTVATQPISEQWTGEFCIIT
jgi:hypothetical protein